MKKIFQYEAKTDATKDRPSQLRWAVLRTCGRASVRQLIVIFAVLITVSGGIFFFTKFAQAATYNFVQSSWVGGVTANTAVHASNQTGWTQYSAATGVTAGTNVQMPAPTSYAFMDDGATSTTPVSAIAKGGVWSNGTNSNTVVSGTGMAANVVLSSTPTAVNAWDSFIKGVPSTTGDGSFMLRNGSDNDIYVTQGCGGNPCTGFYKFSISGNSWTTLASTPGYLGDNGTSVMRNGADDQIYVKQGSGSTGFWRYSISSNSWTVLTAAPGSLGNGSRMIRNGADNDIYVTRGNSTTSFYKYSISGNSWTTLTPTPASISSGASILRNGADDDIYVTRGHNGLGTADTGLYKYSISANSWTTLATAPSLSSTGSNAIRNGAEDSIYWWPSAGTTDFYKYSISANSWTALAVMPGTMANGGADMIRNGADNDIYVTQGNFGVRTGFWKYSISGNSWTTLTVLPSAMGLGSKMIRSGAANDIYVTVGDNTNTFYKYSISGNSWTGSSVSNLTASQSLYQGSTMTRNGSDNDIYVTGGNGTDFLKYSISGNSWTTLAVLPSAIHTGSSMIRNSSDNDIYVIAGNNSSGFYKYSISGNSWTTLTAAPGLIGFGSKMIRNGADNDIYVSQGNGATGFYKYSISGNSWTTLTVVPGTVYDGSSMIRNVADDSIYLTRGYTSTGFYTYSISGNSWTTLAVTPATIGTGSSMLRAGASNDIYLSRGGSLSGFYKYSITGNSWTTLAAQPSAIYSGGFMIRNGTDDSIYATQGGTKLGFYQYSISSNSWTNLQPTIGTLTTGSMMLLNGSENYIYLKQGDYLTGFYRFITNTNTYSTSPATFTSAVMDMGATAAFTTLSFTKTTPTNTTLTIDVRAGNTATPDGTWTSWTTNVANSGSIAALAGNRYFQYRANLSTTDATVTPTLSDITVNYNQYTTTTGTLTSSKYDAGDATSLIAKLSWTATGTSTTETIKFQVRSSPDGITWSNWCGPSIACLGSDYFQDADNGVAFAAGHPLKSGANDRYLQYQAFLVSGGSATPVLVSVTPQYVVNAPPNFDATYGTNGVLPAQVTSSADPNWGKVTIGYSVRDVDTSTGSNTPGYITPSFEYSTDSGSTWTSIPTTDLLAADITNKAVNGVTYNTYTATWTATSTIPNLYNTTMKVRATANDNEAANNTAQAVSGLFTLDTKAPVSGAGNTQINSSVGATTASLIITATDDSQLQYRACNDAAFPTSDAKGNSCAWSTLGGNMASTTVTWTPTGLPSNETVYVQLRDALGNITAKTPVSPATPGNFDFKDVSNTAVNAFWEFISWAVFTNVSNSTFSAYKLYTSTDGTNYSLLTTITDPALNYYRDNIVTATSSLHYYKMDAVDTDGDISHYTTPFSDIPNGTGGTDLVPPVISNIAVPSVNLKNTSAQVTFTTDKLAQATVQYRISGAGGWTTVSSVSYATSSSVYLTGLTSNTLYNLQVKASDAFGNVSAYSAGPNFTTVGGPVITNVTTLNVNDVSATIFWNTSTSSDSYIYYSNNVAMTSPSTTGSAALVSCIAAVCQHQVTISSLTAGVQYYYYVKSTDGTGNATTDTNSNAYYTFTTTLDTTPPVISAISTPVIAAKQAVVVWKTDELATSQVLYGPSTGVYPKFTVTDMTKSIYHVVTLSVETVNAGAAGGMNELAPTTKYYYVVKSADVAGNTATSPEQTFTTPNTGDVTIVAVSITNTATGTGTVTPDTTPPTISNIKATSIDSFDENISFATSKNAVSFVDYGKDPTYGSNVGDPLLTTSHTTKLTNLTMGTTYHYRIKAIDGSGNSATSDDQTFKTPFLSEQKSTSTVPLDDATLLQSKIEDLVQSALPSLTAPFVTTPKISDITEHGATVTWTTNVKAYGLLGYATDDEFKIATSTYSSELSASPDRETTHTVALKNLKSNTKYHIQAKGYVFQTVVGKSDDLTFLTKPSQIQGSVVERTKSSFTIAWTTDESATSVVEYKDVDTGITARNTDDAMRTAHSVKIENLPSGSTYEVNISGVNKEGNTLEAITPVTVTVPRDLIPPVISGFKVDNALVPGRADRIQTIVSWKTDKPSDSTVYYEEGAGTPTDTKELANKASVTGSFVTSHAVILPGLKPGAIYRLKVTSVDDSGNSASFGPRTIITPQQTQSITDVIFKNFEDSFKFLRKF